MASNFDNFLADFAQGGNRYNAALKLVMSGKSSGMSADDIIDRAHAVGVKNRDADIRRLWENSKVEPNQRSSAWRPGRRGRPAEMPAEPIKREDRDFVPTILREYCKTNPSGAEALAAIEETINLAEADYLAKADADIYAKTAARQIRAMCKPGEKIWAGTLIGDKDFATAHHLEQKTPLKPPRQIYDDPAARGLAIRGIYDAHTLADLIEQGVVAKIPTHISLNPVTGEAATLQNADGKGTHLSFDCAATIAAYRHVIIEWDKLFDLDAQGVKRPSRAHIETVAGLIRYAIDHPDRFRLICATWTGGKSIHVALRVKAATVEEYKRQTAALRDRFASADDENFRIDPGGWENGYNHIRLAGAIRPETGRRARLLWIETNYSRPRPGPAQPPPAPPMLPPTPPPPPPKPPTEQESTAQDSTVYKPKTIPTAPPWILCDHRSCKKCVHYDICPVAWYRPSPVIPKVVEAVEMLIAFDWPPPDANALIEYVAKHQRISTGEAAVWIRRTEEGGAIIEAIIDHTPRYAIHAVDFARDPVEREQERSDAQGGQPRPQPRRRAHGAF